MFFNTTAFAFRGGAHKLPFARRILAAVPFKGQVLNLTSAWWFEKTASTVPNAVVDVSDPNFTIAKKVPPPTLEATQGQIGGLLSQCLYKCHQTRVAYVGDWLEICPWVASRVGASPGDLCLGGGEGLRLGQHSVSIPPSLEPRIPQRLGLHH